jgi:hypothetical protein
LPGEPPIFECCGRPEHSAVTLGRCGLVPIAAKDVSIVALSRPDFADRGCVHVRARVNRRSRLVRRDRLWNLDGMNISSDSSLAVWRPLVPARLRAYSAPRQVGCFWPSRQSFVRAQRSSKSTSASARKRRACAAPDVAKRQRPSTLQARPWEA